MRARLVRPRRARSGPIGDHDVPVIADRAVAAMSDFVCGANEDGYHYVGVNFGRDFARAARVRRHPQRRGRRPQPGRQGPPRRSAAASRSATSSSCAPSTPRRMDAHLSRRGRPDRARWRWAATASASRASSPRRSSRTTTSAASSGRSRSRRSSSPSRRSDTARAAEVKALAERLHDELTRRRHRRAAGRPRRAARGHVRRPGADRHSAPHHDRRARTEGGPGRVSGAPRGQTSDGRGRPGRRVRPRIDMTSRADYRVRTNSPGVRIAYCSRSASRSPSPVIKTSLLRRPA